MTPPFRIEGLAATHDRETFGCGIEALDLYLRQQASQDIKRRIAQCYVAVHGQSGRIAGYYTLSAGSIVLADLPETIARKLPRYPAVPVARLGRLAIDRDFQGHGLGAALLWDAATRALRSELGVYAIAVDATNPAATAFYRHHGFVALAAHPDKLFLPLATFSAGNPG